jgi:flavin-dependent dehydrogenase
VGDSAGHCFPLSGEGIRTAFYFGIACGRELRSVLSGERGRDEALRRYARFSASHSRAFGLALRLQWLVPRLAPRVLTLALRALAHQALVDRAFGCYLDQAHPAFAGAHRSAATPPPAMPLYTAPAAGSRDAAAVLGRSDAHER